MSDSRNPAPSTIPAEPVKSAFAGLAKSWPGPAIAVADDGKIIAASPQSSLQARMRAPFKLPEDPAGYEITDTSGRHWTVSAKVDNIRLATADPARQPDAQTRFTAAVSHEIRTPLNGILGMAALLEEGELAPAQREYAMAIKKSGARLLDLLNNVLDYSRIETGDIPLEYASFSPEDLVQDVAELLSPRAHSAGLDLAAIVDPGLPTRLIGDAGRLRQILFNLAGNAIKFTEEGGVLLEVSRGPEGQGLSIIVRDTGLGVPEEAKSRLFEAFSQARAGDARRDGGVGLGLAIVAKLTRAMKGETTLTSLPGSGAMFRVDIPLNAASDAKPTPRQPRGKGLDGVNVSVFLPAPSTLACARALASGGYHVPVGDMAAMTTAEVAIVDAALPPARIEHIASRQPTLVVLRPEDRTRIAQFREMGCAGYLIRPLRAASIIERVEVARKGGTESNPLDDLERNPGDAGRVLIADDNAVNTLLASRALKAAGFHVDTASTGAEALERASETAYSLVFMDIRMPVMDGLEATRRIRALPGDAGRTPIIAITADIDPDLETRAREAGVSQLAAKPIDPPHLRTLAERWAQTRLAAAE